MIETIAERHERECALPKLHASNYKRNFKHFEEIEHTKRIDKKGVFVRHKFLYEDGSVINMSADGDFWSWLN